MGEIDADLNMRFGMGVCVYENTRLYEGYWKEDKRDGFGSQNLKNGEKY